MGGVCWEVEAGLGDATPTFCCDNALPCKVTVETKDAGDQGEYYPVVVNFDSSGAAEARGFTPAHRSTAPPLSGHPGPFLPRAALELRSRVVGVGAERAGGMCAGGRRGGARGAVIQRAEEARQGEWKRPSPP